MPSALRARAKPFAALTFMDVLLPATSYRGEAVLSRTTVVSLRDPDRLPSQRGEETVHEGSAPDDDPGPRPDPARESRPRSRSGAGARGRACGALGSACGALGRARGALGRARGADDVGGACLALSRLVGPSRT